MLTITKDFAFDASHSLRNPKWSREINEETYGKCINLHGHTYKLSVTLEGTEENGMIINFSKLKEIVNREIIEKFDHQNLNNFYALPTCEIMVKDIFMRLRLFLNGLNYRLKRVDLYEQIYPTNSYASYESSNI